MLIKRGFGITLDESLNAAEYLALGRQPQGRLRPARHEDQHGRPAPQLRRLLARPGRQAPDAHAGVHRSLALGRHALALRPDGILDIIPRRRTRRRRRCQHGAGRLPPESRARRWSTVRRRCCCRNFRIFSTTSPLPAKPTSSAARSQASTNRIERARIVARRTRHGIAPGPTARDRTQADVRSGRTRPSACIIRRSRRYSTDAPASRRLVSRYYDTPAHRLRNAGVTLRLRRAGRRWLQTAKGAGTAVAGLHQRIEYEWPLTQPRLDRSLLASTPWKKLFAAASDLRLRVLDRSPAHLTAARLCGRYTRRVVHGSRQDHAPGRDEHRYAKSKSNWCKATRVGSTISRWRSPSTYPLEWDISARRSAATPLQERATSSRCARHG